MKKRSICLFLCFVMLFGATGCQTQTPGVSAPAASSGQPASSAPSVSTPSSPAVSAPTVTPTDLPDFMVMSGPTGVGAAKLLSDNELVSSVVHTLASFSVVADNEAVKNALINGDADIAAVATNMAATLYAKTNGALQVLAVNTLGVLYILEKGESIQTLSGLRGKTVYATGQGANPEYILNYLLTENGISPAEVDIQWMTAQEVIAKMTTSEEAVCMLPVPAATTLMMKDPAVRQAISLSEEWDDLGQGALTQGCIVARTDYIEKNPQAVENFLAAYEHSLNYMKDEANRDHAAALVARYAITANDKIAAKAIPQCNLTFVTGQEMKGMLESFYQVLFQANPASIGGSMPYDSFYYGTN